MLRALTFLPSVTRKIDNLLLVKEFNAIFFDNAICEEDLQAALTPPAALCDYDYERLEFIGAQQAYRPERMLNNLYQGDTYLKYLSSAYFFVTADKKMGEGALHQARQEVVSNKALLQDANRAGLAPYIQAKPFSYKHWKPVGFSVLPDPPKGSDQSLDKEDLMVPLDPSSTSTHIQISKTSHHEDIQFLGNKVWFVHGMYTHRCGITKPSF
jgi:endoribonuclease Dicer